MSYDPTQDDNRVLGGSLDVMAAIRVLATVKVSADPDLQASRLTSHTGIYMCVDSSI